jgi:excisionase family DNA binding protein
MLQVINLTEAAKRLGVHRRSLERLIEDGTGPAVVFLTPRRRGVTEPALEAWIKSRELKVAPRRARKAKAMEAAILTTANGGSGTSPPIGGML